LKHVEFYSKNKFEKLVQLVGFIIRIYHDARSPELQIQNIPLKTQFPLVSSIENNTYEMACTIIYLQESVSTFTRTVVNTNKRKMHESEPIILIWSEILKEKKKHTVPSNNSAQLQKTCMQCSTLTYLWLSNVFRMRNSVLGMVDATLRYAVKPA